MAKLYFKYGAMGSSKSAQALITKFNYEEQGMTVWLIKPSTDTRDGADIIRSRIGLQKHAQIILPTDSIIELYHAYDPSAGNAPDGLKAISDHLSQKAFGSAASATTAAVSSQKATSTDSAAQTSPALLSSSDPGPEADQSLASSRRRSDVIIADESQFFTPAQIDELRAIVDDENVPVLCFGLRTDFQTKFFPGSMRLMELADSITEIKTVCACGSKATVNARIDARGRIITEGEQVFLGGNDSYVAMCHKCWRRKIAEQRAHSAHTNASAAQRAQSDSHI